MYPQCVTHLPDSIDLHIFRLKLAFLLLPLEIVGPPSLSSLVYWIYLGLAIMQSCCLCSVNKEIKPNCDLWQLVSLRGRLGSDQQLWPAFRRRCQLLRPGYCGITDNRRKSSAEKPFSKITSWPKEAGPVLLLLLICLLWWVQQRAGVQNQSSSRSHLSFSLGLEEKTLLSKKEKMKLRKERWLQSKCPNHSCMEASQRVTAGFLCTLRVGESVGLWQDNGWGWGGWTLLKNLQACSPATGEKVPGVLSPYREHLALRLTLYPNLFLLFLHMQCDYLKTFLYPGKTLCQRRSSRFLCIFSGSWRVVTSCVVTAWARQHPVDVGQPGLEPHQLIPGLWEK